MTELERHDIHPSINRAHQMLGADRNMVLSAGFIAAVGTLCLVTLWGLALMVVFWWACVIALQMMTKADPIMRFVFMQYRTFNDYYPAKGGLHAERREIPRNWR